METDDKPNNPHYSAKDGYKSDSAIIHYEKERFSGLLGKYRYYREQKAVTQIIDMLPNDLTFADCPCGNGRWWPVLVRRARRIIAVDVSQTMLRYAAKRKKNFDIEIEIHEGDAENLCLADGSVDYTFSHALTKHLPIPIQYKVLVEFARVSRHGVICSFGIFSHLSYEFWRRRNLEESYPTSLEELGRMASSAGLEIKAMRKCTTPVGVEHSILFSKVA